ncbi:MAG: hypothetical protein Q4G09_05950 [Clostridia bacterium]|nr:hypothetical protein [Clostridia bacterium]
MEDKKTLKISLGTVICIFVIFLLIISLGIIYYLGFIKNLQNPVENINNESKSSILHSEKEETIILYQNGEIKGASPQCPELDEQNLEKYSTTYNLYKDGQNIGKYDGTVSISEDFNEHYISFDNLYSSEYDFAVSTDYNPFPRTYTKTENISTDIRDAIPSLYELEGMETIDLDGNGKNENIILYKHTTNEKSPVSNNNVVYSGIYLYSSYYKKIILLACYRDQMYGGEEWMRNKIFWC